jgi:transcriptional regulator with XRE-family HTH domain
MFDTKKVGTRIALLRKAKDMTQMELADQLMVSYQAVSNWERGNTMPDIAKLSDLSQILGVSIEELLGSKTETEIVQKMIDKREDLKIEEVAQVAPILKPSQVEEAVNKTDNEAIDLSTLTMLAPFLSEKRLRDMVDKVQFSNLEELVPVAPFMESDQLSKLINRQQKITGTLVGLTSLAPFLDRDQIGAFIEKLDLKGEINQIVGLAPFMDEIDLDKLALRFADEKIDPSAVYGLAPFMSQEGLGKLVGRLSPEGLKKHLSALAPFLDSTVLTPIARDLMQKGDMHTLMSIMPFINPEEL